MPIHELTEDSPLLSESYTVAYERDVSSNTTSLNSNGLAKVLAGGEDEERLDAQSERVTHYEGLPEVRKQLKYIIPAIAIGVRTLKHTTRYKEETLMCARYFFPLATRRSLCRVTVELEAN